MHNPYALMIEFRWYTDLEGSICHKYYFVLKRNNTNIVGRTNNPNSIYIYIYIGRGKSHDVIYLNCLIYTRQHLKPSSKQNMHNFI